MGSIQNTIVNIEIIMVLDRKKNFNPIDIVKAFYRFAYIIILILYSKSNLCQSGSGR